MNGQPVWLVSVSRKSVITDRFVPVVRWTPDQMSEARHLMEQVLRGVGDKQRQRRFRMNVTLCLHRALTDAEVAQLPGGCAFIPVNLAGGPVEVLWETEPGSDSTKPCEHPIRQPFPGEPSDPDLWLPVDCGRCAPCRARAALEGVAA